MESKCQNQKNYKDFSPILLLTLMVVVDCLQKENENHNRMPGSGSF